MALQLVATRCKETDWQQLRSVIETGDLRQLGEILANGSVINFAGDHGVTPLMHAVRHNQLAVVRSLIEHGADLNAVRADGFTALLLATFFGYFDVLHVLVENGANLKVNTRYATCAQTWATARGFHDIAQYLQEQQDTYSLRVVGPLKADNQVPKRPGVHRDWPNEELKPGPDDTPARSIVAQAAATPDSAQITDVKSEITERSTPPLIVRRLKDPPEIWDLVHESPNDFHSGSAFLSRIMSAKPKTIGFTLAVILIFFIGTFAGFRLRTEGERSTTGEIAAPSGSAGGTNAGDAFIKPDIDKGPLPAEQTKSLVSPSENPEVKVEPTESLQPKLESTRSLTGTRSLVVSSQRMERRQRASATAQEGTRLSDSIPRAEDVDKTSHPQTSQVVEPTSNETRVTENSLPVKKPTHSTTNTQLITRPFGSRVKPKTIQWP